MVALERKLKGEQSFFNTTDAVFLRWSTTHPAVSVIAHPLDSSRPVLQSLPTAEESAVFARV